MICPEKIVCKKEIRNVRAIRAKFDRENVTHHDILSDYLAQPFNAQDKDVG